VFKKTVFLSMVLLLTGCSNITVLDPKSATGKEQAFLIWLSLAIMSVVILVVFILFTWFVIKYRSTEKNHDSLPIDVKGNLKLELTYTIIPCLLLIVLAVPTVQITMDQSPSTEAKEEQDGVHINVVAKQFEWAFEHSNGKKVKDELVIPEEETIIFHLHSEDVIHSFWVPELAGKVDVFPNKELTYIIHDAEKGTYDGKCAEFCGIQHTNMVFNVKVVDQESYDTYLDEDASEGGEQ
jgi:cytochrome c oxidase subunit 2